MARRIPRSALLAALAAAAAFALYVPALSFGWVNWDDGIIVVAESTHPRLRFLSGSAALGLHGRARRRLPAAGFPQLRARLPGVGLRRARGYHLTNALLHALCAALVLPLRAAAPELLARPGADARARTWAADAGGAVRRARLRAATPLRVESVAWISERRDPLCAAFWLAAVVAYLRAREPGKRKGALLAVEALFAAACLAKGTAVTLPAVLLVIDVFLLRRPVSPWPRVEKIPRMLVPGAAARLRSASYARQARRARHAGDAGPNHGLVARAAQTAYALAYYVRKTVWPVGGLSPFYELRPPLDPLEPRFLLSAARARRLSRRRRGSGGGRGPGWPRRARHTRRVTARERHLPGRLAARRRPLLVPRRAAVGDPRRRSFARGPARGARPPRSPPPRAAVLALAGGLRRAAVVLAGLRRWLVAPRAGRGFGLADRLAESRSRARGPAADAGGRGRVRPRVGSRSRLSAARRRLSAASRGPRRTGRKSKPCAPRSRPAPVCRKALGEFRRGVRRARESRRGPALSAVWPLAADPDRSARFNLGVATSRPRSRRGAFSRGRSP